MTVRNNIKTRFIGCYVPEDEYEEIQRNIVRYGFKGNSDYLRGALDFFDSRRYNASKSNEVSTIQDCVNLLLEHKRGIENSMMIDSLKDLDGNLKSEVSGNDETLKETGENLKDNLKGMEVETLKETGENFKTTTTATDPTEDESFQQVILTLIKITHMKGRPTDSDFVYQAKRCGKSKKEVMDYYDENYLFFTEEADKYA